MLFNSQAFLIFASLFFLFWPWFRQTNALRWGYLIVASFIFYGWWDYRYLLLLIAIGMIDFFAALGMVARPRQRHLLLSLSIASNLGILFSFKYLLFAAENLTLAASWFGFDGSLVDQVPKFMWTVPVGISFYTFQSMSYTIDVFTGQLKPTRNILHYFAYLSLFPQLMAGPIVRASDLLPQLLTARKSTREDQWEGLRLIAHGFFKKVVVADTLATLVSAAFAQQTTQGSGLYWWVISLAFTIQIYCDFSGYSDIARGLGKWMGYEIMVNFNHPYTATSMQDFWNRWHISLTSWFRDYIYYPLVRRNLEQIRSGAAWVGQWRMLVILWITMLASGLWHGAAWHFVLWGAAHALFLSIEILTRWPLHLKKWPGGRWLAWMLTMLQVVAAMFIFRAESMDQIGVILTKMFLFQDGLKLGIGSIITMRDLLVLSILIGIMIMRELYFFIQGEQLLKKFGMHSWVRGPFVVAAILILSIYLRAPKAEFIYFQF
ncbi:MAG: MBOAT family protein [Magnetococcales bacterium]|nr:MBOAT family protein [Magnetococcales bacterium]